jgi:hypothetical protein
MTYGDSIVGGAREAGQTRAGLGVRRIPSPSMGDGGVREKRGRRCLARHGETATSARAHGDAGGRSLSGRRASFTGNLAALRFALSSIGREMSVPSTNPEGPMSAAASMAEGPAPAATSSTR